MSTDQLTDEQKRRFAAGLEKEAQYYEALATEERAFGSEGIAQDYEKLAELARQEAKKYQK